MAHMAETGKTRFQSTLPTRGSDNYDKSRAIYISKFQSTLPTRGSDDVCKGAFGICPVSIHAPHEGERHEYNAPIHPIYKFQSTLPTRGSDVIELQREGEKQCFNPRSPRGGATPNSSIVAV